MEAFMSRTKRIKNEKWLKKRNVDDNFICKPHYYFYPNGEVWRSYVPRKEDWSEKEVYDYLSATHYRDNRWKNNCGWYFRHLYIKSVRCKQKDYLKKKVKYEEFDDFIIPHHIKNANWYYF